MFEMTRRVFHQTCAAIAASTVIPLPAKEAAPLRLFEVWDNATAGLQWDEQTWMAIWAKNEQEALDTFWDRYEYAGYCDDDRSGIEVVRTHGLDRRAILGDDHPEVEIENDCTILRMIGWREEGDDKCDRCEKYEMGIVRVCPECYCCEECGCECEGGPHG